MQNGQKRKNIEREYEHMEDARWRTNIRKIVFCLPGARDSKEFPETFLKEFRVPKRGSSINVMKVMAKLSIYIKKNFT